MERVCLYSIDREKGRRWVYAECTAFQIHYEWGGNRGKNTELQLHPCFLLLDLGVKILSPVGEMENQGSSLTLSGAIMCNSQPFWDSPPQFPSSTYSSL